VVTTVAINRNERRTGLDVFGDTATLNWKSLQGHQTLANLVVGCRVDLSALGITEEVVQGIKVALSGVKCCMLSNICSMADGVVDRAI